MNLVDAEQLANKLITEWLHPSWKFAWTRSHESLGDCFIDLENGLYLIRLSRPFTLANSREVTEETIRHEIAHALTYDRADSRTHGAAWQANAVRVGARPEACADDAVTPPFKWQAVCPSCEKFNGRRRWTKDMDGDLACQQCCTLHGDGGWDARFVFTYKKMW